MWQGARGNQVSPDPWDNDMEVEEVPMEPPSYDEWDQPKQTIPLKPVKKMEPKVKKEVKVNEAKKEEPAFVYQKRQQDKDGVYNEDLDVYINNKFNKNHAWTPYLWERKR